MTLKVLSRGDLKHFQGALNSGKRNKSVLVAHWVISVAIGDARKTKGLNSAYPFFARTRRNYSAVGIRSGGIGWSRFRKNDHSCRKVCQTAGTQTFCKVYCRFFYGSLGKRPEGQVDYFFPPRY